MCTVSFKRRASSEKLCKIRSSSRRKFLSLSLSLSVVEVFFPRSHRRLVNCRRSIAIPAFNHLSFFLKEKSSVNISYCIVSDNLYLLICQSGRMKIEKTTIYLFPLDSNTLDFKLFLNYLFLFLGNLTGSLKISSVTQHKNSCRVTK